jgi:hypothetical protein
VGTIWFLGIVLVIVGVGIRLRVARQYIDLHVTRYGGAPPRGWLWTRVDDPEVERSRRTMAAGSLVAIAGAILVIVEALRS